MSSSKDRCEIFEDIARMYRDGTSYGGLSQLDHALQAAYSASKRPDGDDALIVAALLHDIGWKLAGASPFVIDATAAATAEASKSAIDDIKPSVLPPNDDLETADVCNGDPKHSLAAKLGILAVCVPEEGRDVCSEEQQRAQHDVIGATYLRMRGFIERVPHLVEGHVLAKRYLCWKEKDYYEKLSPGSKRTLVFQGGPMSEAEARVFENDPYFHDSLTMRRFDEAAKEPFLEGIPDFRSYRDVVLRCIVGPTNRTAEETKRTCSYVRDFNKIVGLRSVVVSTHSTDTAAGSSDLRDEGKKDTADTTTLCSHRGCSDRTKPMETVEAQEYAKQNLGVEWTIVEDTMLRLRRRFVAKNFKFALEFVNACGILAEKVGHHPDLHITSYRTVTVDVFTHKVGGLTEADFALAGMIDALPVTCSPAWLRKRNGAAGVQITKHEDKCDGTNVKKRARMKP